MYPEGSMACNSLPNAMCRAVLAIAAAWLAPGAGPAIADGATSADWIRIDAGAGLSLQVPRGSRYVQGKAVDSLSGTVSGPGFTLDLDYGAFSDPLTSIEAFSKVETDTATIDSRPARIMFATFTRPVGNRPYFFGLHVPRVAPGAQDGRKLTVTAHLRRRGELTLIRRIVDTLRFQAQQ